MGRLPPTPKASSHVAQQTMKANRRRDTAPERAVRRLLHRAGLRYRVDYAPDQTDRRRKADIVFTKQKIAIYIDGCFWHGCPVHYIEPRTNVDYWRPKIAGNIQRDQMTGERLLSLGWTVLRFWEHEKPGDIAALILTVVQRGKPAPPGASAPRE